MADGPSPVATAPRAPSAVEKLRSEIIQPFIDLIHAPRALWGVNLAFIIEGTVYFGFLSYLAIYFSEFVFAGLASPEARDDYAHKMVMVLTAGVTIAMFFLGAVADKRGVRFALITALVVMFSGRCLIAGAPNVLGLAPDGLWSPLHLVTMGGILLVIIGYGTYFPAAYAAVRQLTTPKTAAMGFAMLYALMNLGGWLPTFAFLIRDDHFLGAGISGVYWVYTFLTVISLLCTLLLLTRKTAAQAIASAKAETERIQAQAAVDKSKAQADGVAQTAPAVDSVITGKIPLHLWGFVLVIAAVIFFVVAAPWNRVAAIGLLGVWLTLAFVRPASRVVARHPLANAKFFFFIFSLIPVQTLFAYNWLVLPQYVKRAFDGVIGRYFEVASNLSPLLIFVAVPMIAAITQKAQVYKMMVLGTLVMASAAFFPIIGPHWWTLCLYLLVMAIGEAMWQPRFLQYAAEIAPEGRTGEYMGVAQLPWFLTKVLVPMLYSGWMIGRYCPATGPQDTRFMWLVFSCIAICTPILLFLAKPWLGKNFKTKSA